MLQSYFEFVSFNLHQNRLFFFFALQLGCFLLFFFFFFSVQNFWPQNVTTDSFYSISTLMYKFDEILLRNCFALALCKYPLMIKLAAYFRLIGLSN